MAENDRIAELPGVGLTDLLGRVGGDVIEELVGMTGDTGLVIGGFYTDGKRKVICMTDHIDKGIWLNGLPSVGDGDFYWCGKRLEFDFCGWVPCA